MRFSRSIHLKMFLFWETLTPIIRTGLPIPLELIDLVNSVVIFLSQITLFRLSYWIPDCDSHRPALLDLFISSDASVCSTIAFSPLGNSDHFVFSVSIDFPSNSKQDAPFHCTTSDYCRADWDGLRDHLIIPWEDIFKLGASAGASEFC